MWWLLLADIRRFARHPAVMLGWVGWALALAGVTLWISPLLERFAWVPTGPRGNLLTALGQPAPWFMTVLAWRSLRREHTSGRASDLTLSLFGSRSLFFAKLLALVVMCTSIAFLGFVLVTLLGARLFMAPPFNWSMWRVVRWSLKLAVPYSWPLGCEAPLLVMLFMLLIPRSRRSVSAVITAGAVLAALQAVIRTECMLLSLYLSGRWGWELDARNLVASPFGYTEAHLVLIAAAIVFIAPRYRRLLGEE